jgi:hypothetical protein
MYHTATNKLINLRCLPPVDVLKVKVLLSFRFTHIANFDDFPSS